MMNQGLLEEPMQQPGQPMQQPGQPMQQPGQPMQQPGQPMQQPSFRNYQENPLGEEDEEEFQKFVISAQKLIHSPQTRDTVLERIGVSQEGPIGDISDLTVLITDRIDQQFIKDQGKPVDYAVKIQGANVVTGQLIEVAEASGKVPKMSEEEKAVAFSYAVQKYTDRMIQRGEVSKEELQQYAQEAVAIGQQSGEISPERMQGAANKTPMPAPAPNPATSENPIHPKETMSQKLARGGLLNE